jgi:hypothetical protein
VQDARPFLIPYGSRRAESGPLLLISLSRVERRQARTGSAERSIPPSRPPPVTHPPPVGAAGLGGDFTAFATFIARWAFARNLSWPRLTEAIQPPFSTLHRCEIPLRRRPAQPERTGSRPSVKPQAGGTPVASPTACFGEMVWGHRRAKPQRIGSCLNVPNRTRGPNRNQIWRYDGPRQKAPHWTATLAPNRLEAGAMPLKDVAAEAAHASHYSRLVGSPPRALKPQRRLQRLFPGTDDPIYRYRADSSAT